MHKSVEAPSYDDDEVDSIYTLITRYKNYLVYKLLSPEKCSYIKREQTMFILNALIQDTRFRIGLIYVDETTHVFRMDCILLPDTMFPLDLEIDKITVTIDKQYKEYTPGENAARPRTINTCARGSQV